MSEKLTKEGFANFIFLQILTDQTRMLKRMFDDEVLSPLLLSSSDKAELKSLLDKMCNSAELLEDDDFDGLVSIEIMIPEEPASWPITYSGNIKEKIKALLIEVQIFSFFPYYSLLQNTFKDTPLYVDK